MSVCINKRDQYWHDTTPDIFVQYYRVTEKKKQRKCLSTWKKHETVLRNDNILKGLENSGFPLTAAGTRSR